MGPGATNPTAALLFKYAVRSRYANLANSERLVLSVTRPDASS
jgi:hypothetical protein